MILKSLSIGSSGRKCGPGSVWVVTWFALLICTGSEAASFVLPPADQSVIGSLERVTARHEDTLADIGRRFGVGYRELRIANPSLDPWLPGEGAEVLLPTRYVLPDAPRRGRVLSLAEMRIFYYPPPPDRNSARVVTYPVSIGRQDWSTPLGATHVQSKMQDPSWYPPASVREEHAAEGEPLPVVVPPGPDNPLGRHALRLARPGYLIHGTNKPYGIGMRVTHGCIRMTPEDIDELYQAVPVGTPVHIVHQPFKLGWHADRLYLEVHPPLESDPASPLEDPGQLMYTLVWATRLRPELSIDWDQVEAMVARPMGVPSVVATPESDAVNRDDGGARAPGFLIEPR